MAESVNTGGVKRFVYSNNTRTELSRAEKNEISEAYAKAEERKRREKKRKILIWIIIFLLIVSSGIFILFNI